jgi:hypothetical protein
MSEELSAHVRNMLEAPAPHAITAVAAAVRKLLPDAAAILAYGSALRDSTPANTLIDLYVLTRSARGVSANPIARLACALVPPNVYYAEVNHDGQTYRAKYAVLSLSQLERRLRSVVSNPYFWARLAQPVRLVWCRDKESEAAVVSAILTACRTACANARGTSPAASPPQLWSNLFRETYRTEFRPESADRARAIVDADQNHYGSLSLALNQVAPINPNWPLRRLAGKTLSILRLVKASFTFHGGADYIAWKIKRHSGVEIHVTDFQRKHPLLAGLLLLPQLLRRGAVR